jgi:hypothetical protein
MSYNDTNWSVFWSHGSTSSLPPDSNNIYAGKHVGEDRATQRANEVIGYVVIEAGQANLNGLQFEATVGPTEVHGMDNGAPFTYSTSLPQLAAAVLTQAGMSGGNGGWAVLTGSGIAANGSFELGIDEDTVADSERAHNSEAVAYIAFATSQETPAPSDEPGPGPNLSHGVVSGVTSTGWTRVQFNTSYASPVVVTTPQYDPASPPVVVRVRNADSSGFDVRIAPATGTSGPVDPVTVSWFAVEQGVYNIADHGVKMEAVTFTSSVTDHDKSWVGETQQYSNAYDSPVVLGQVMSHNDSRWSAFWSYGTTSSLAPDSANLRVGKHVGEDSATNRANEVIGYVVIEAGKLLVDGTRFDAAVGPASVPGIGNGASENYSTSLLRVSNAVLSQAGMSGGNGGWAVLVNPGITNDGQIKLAIDEDTTADEERKHNTERVAYIAFAG